MAENKKTEGLNLQPQALEAEEAVLGSMMIDEDAANKAISILGSSHYFYKDSHKKIFDAMLVLMNNSNPIDTVSVSDELKKGKNLKSVGGIYYLTGLVDKVPTSARVETYAEIVKEKGMLRDLITTSHEISKKALDAGDSVGSILDEAEQSIFSLTEQKDSKIYQHIEPILSSTVKRIENMAANPGSIIGVPSGIIDLDKLTAGFQNGDLIILAGRPSMGKTALALTIARNAAIENKSATAIFSLEMSSDQLGQRLLTSEARVDNALVRRGSPNIKWKNINIASGKLAQAPLYIDDTPALSILDLRSRARRLKRERNIELLIVDYLQLMQGPKNSENRQNEISQITQSLKALAKELDIPVIALSQLSRAVEQRTKKEPMLSDLRESGAIEQDADVVIFLYRPAVYDKEDQDLKGLAYLIVAKQRNGPTGRVTATFIDTYARFDNHQEF
ncbi:MAG: replicative DNA helicase [Candidatus Neomarinimicrobiota bacterium]|nr:MAG: replicative DNA helicase [Candidatus Neomarinimicrobiota bacterium]